MLFIQIMQTLVKWVDERNCYAEESQQRDVAFSMLYLKNSFRSL